MAIRLEKAGIEDAKALHAMQVKAFLPLLEKYQDTETNPASESLEKTLYRISDPLTGFYKILRDNILVGGIAVKHIAPKTIFLGPIFIDPGFHNQKIAQKALELIEDRLPDVDVFELATILQEEANVHLYEKMGYACTGEQKKINTSIHLVFYRKNLFQA
jgi:GNAT superfamily N-acetyltransferase